ncbi:hypothetical protein [Mesorhizobium sp. M7A.F.Ca.US.011.01.1.1]|uniref:hypothetical protein n=1 Tax=Mesorhizobium sp. M7A.F.Ca.US.011.01.1.1 TaxID=2496741 RepID=UPI001FE1B7B2|nr:hypothetical protein [Mesorhizobium sp. M7A.F.Ca.US.011.01.1.1]
MGIKALPEAVKAGEVTFKVKNDSKDTVHEMIVMYHADPGKPLSYVEAKTAWMRIKLATRAKYQSSIPARQAR